MRFISDIGEFNSLYSLIGSHLNWANELPKDGKQPIVKYTDWNELARDRGFDFLISLARLGKDREFYFFAPELHIFADFTIHARVFPILELNTQMTESELIESLSLIPEGGKLPLDFTSNSEFAIFPKSMNWYLYGAYEAELSKIVSYVGMPQSIKDVPYFISENEAMKRMRSLFPQALNQIRAM